MNAARLRSLLVGPDLGFLGTCLLVGILGGFSLGWIVRSVGPDTLGVVEFTLVAVPIALALALRGDGIISIWIGLFPVMFMLVRVGTCSGYVGEFIGTGSGWSECLFVDYGQIASTAVHLAIVFGTIGFLLARASTWLHDEDRSLRTVFETR